MNPGQIIADSVAGPNAQKGGKLEGPLFNQAQTDAENPENETEIDLAQKKKAAKPASKKQETGDCSAKMTEQKQIGKMFGGYEKSQDKDYDGVVNKVEDALNKISKSPDIGKAK